MLSKHHLVAGVLVAVAAVACTALPPWSTTQAIAPHYVYAYALAIMLMWLPIVRGLRDSHNISEPLLFAALASGLLTLSQAHHVGMLLLGHALLFSLGAVLLLGRYARFGAALHFVSSLAVYVYAASFLLRAIILN